MKKMADAISLLMTKKKLENFVLYLYHLQAHMIRIVDIVSAVVFNK